MKTDIKSMTQEELMAALEEQGAEKYRAEQIFSWLYRGARSFEDMSNISKSLREKLSGVFSITSPEIAQKQTSASDGTIKYLWRLGDGSLIESVVMSYDYGNTVCVSTQVGCRQGCAFCASSIGGLTRNLQPSEILDQVLLSGIDSGKKISHVVLMGIGEPLDNYENVLRFISLATDARGLGFGMRKITISTCGIISMLDKLGQNKLQLNLCISLHAPDDETRSKLMPVNRDTGVDAVLRAASRYFEITGRRVSFEYAMIDGVNDSAEQARLLAKKLRATGSHVNLILLNRVDGRELLPSKPAAVRTFTGILESSGINVTIRRRLGRDIDAACGQLRATNN